MSEGAVIQQRPRVFGLSKSRITAFEQCPKKLWLSVYRQDLATADETSALRFAAGHEVGAIACDQHPGGIMVKAEPDLAAALEMTRFLLEAEPPCPIFEATFQHDGVLVRVDVLEPDGAGGWSMAEVKSSTGVKAYHLGDLATQVWVLAAAGVTVTSAVIRHIDNRFVLKREGHYTGLFVDADVGPLIEALIADRPRVVTEARATLAGPEPDLAVGDHCHAPFACEYAAYCNRDAPDGPAWPISLFPNTGRKLALAWADKAVFDVRDIPAGALDNPIHLRVHAATVSGDVFHDRELALAATRDWAFPRVYLDFETIAFAAPRWVGTRPYQNVPFQFSCHVQTQGGGLDHHGYLSLDCSDPRRACAEALLIACGASGASGAVIAYNASFERRCILDLALACPDLAPGLTAIADRLVDLLPVTRASYYHRDQRGSWSIKAVLPTVAPELDYAGLQVGDGVAAQIAWLEAVAPTTSPERRCVIRGALEAYCARDTEAMVVLLGRLLA